MSSRWTPYAILVAITIATYMNGLNGPFLWDDLETVVNNPLIRDIRNIPNIFQASVFGQAAGGNEFYRPLVTLSFLINYQLSELNPLTYHITNLLLHLLSTFLVYGILMRLKQSKNTALLVSALFAVHPIGIEVVTFVSGRSDALVSLFILLSIYGYLRLQESKKWMLTVILSFLAAILSKESTVIVPVLMFLLSWAFVEHRSKMHLRTAAALLIVALLYAGTRISEISATGAGSLSWIASVSLSERLMTVPYTLLMYLKILLWPHPLHMEYHTVTTSLTHPSVWLGVPMLLMLIGLFLKQKTSKRVNVFWLLWILICLAPTLNIIAPQSSTLREHWMYLPSIGAFVLIANLKIWKRYNKENLLIACIAVITALGVLTYERNRDWNDPLRLYAHDLELEPRSFTLWNNLGTEYYNTGNTQLAKQAFINSIEYSPGKRYSIGYNNLGVIVQNEGDADQAIELYKQSIALTRYELAYGNLAELYWNLGRQDEARTIIEEGIQVHPFSQNLSEIHRRISP